MDYRGKSSIKIKIGVWINMNFKYDKVSKAIYLVKDNGKLELVEDNSPSKPVVSLTGDKIVYISPDEWESLSKLVLIDLNNSEKKILIDPTDAQLIPKSVIWVDDNELAIILGYGYGTVAVGGNVMLFNINDNTTKYVTNYPAEIQVTQMQLTEKNVMQIKGIEYTDKNFIYFQEFVDIIKLNNNFS